MLDQNKKKSTAFVRALMDVNAPLRRANSKKLFLKDDARETWSRDKGRCVYCAYPLVPRGWGENAVYFQMYHPHDRGGEVSVHNLITVCMRHRRKYEPGRKLLESHLGANTIPDLIQTLVETVIDIKANKETALYANSVEKLNKIKSELNIAFEDMAATFEYKAMSEWRPEKLEPIVEGVSDIPTIIEALISDPEAAKELEEKLKQTIYTKQYKILRNDP